MKEQITKRYGERLERSVFYKRLEAILPELVNDYGEDSFPRIELEKSIHFEEIKQKNSNSIELRALDSQGRNNLIIHHFGFPARNQSIAKNDIETSVRSGYLRVRWLGAELNAQHNYTSSDLSVYSENIKEGFIINPTDNTLHAIRARDGEFQSKTENCFEGNKNGLKNLPKSGQNQWLTESVDLSLPEVVAFSYFDPEYSCFRKILIPRRITYGNGQQVQGFNFERLLSGPPVQPNYPKHPNLNKY